MMGVEYHPHLYVHLRYCCYLGAPHLKMSEGLAPIEGQCNPVTLEY
jgi:hypothetical protein